jgi:hypothetical protein
MISVEFTNLEMLMGEMLGSILHISPDNGRIIYLTPHSGYGRLAILENLHTDGKHSLRKDSRSYKQYGKLLERARTVIGKRHGIIHNSWGALSNDSETLVANRTTPFLERRPFKPVALDELERLIEDIRKLCDQVVDWTNSNYASWAPYTSQPIAPEQSGDDKSQTPDNP